MENENPVRKLRNALGMNQADFARAIGRSYASVQGYEAGKRPPEDVRRAMIELATEQGLGDIAMVLAGGDWEGKHVTHPGETPISAARKKPPPRNEYYHGLLDEILESGQQDAIDAVQGNLDVFAKTVRLRHPKITKGKLSPRRKSR